MLRFLQFQKPPNYQLIAFLPVRLLPQQFPSLCLQFLLILLTFLAHLFVFLNLFLEVLNHVETPTKNKNKQMKKSKTTIVGYKAKEKK